MLTIKEKIELIQEQCQKHDISGYEIGEKTSVSISSANNILSGRNKKPKNKTLNIILEYIENKIVGTDISNIKEEPANYQKPFHTLTIDDKLNSIYTLIEESSKTNNAMIQQTNTELAKLELTQIEQFLALEKKIFELSSNTKKGTRAS